MDNLPTYAEIINKINDEFNELYDEKQSIQKENEIIISSLADVLFNQKIKTIDNYHYEQKEYYRFL